MFYNPSESEEDMAVGKEFKITYSNGRRGSDHRKKEVTITAETITQLVGLTAQHSPKGMNLAMVQQVGGPVVANEPSWWDMPEIERIFSS